MRHLLLIQLFISAMMLPTLAKAGSADGVLALDNVHIVDAEVGRSGGRQCVRIEGRQLTGIDEAGSDSCRRDAHVVDLGGRYLLPGLIDMHAHLTLGALEVKRDGDAVVMQALPDADITRHNAERLVAFGVTTIRNPAGDLSAAARYKAQLAASELTGPEAFNAGPVINNAEILGLSTAAATADDVQHVVDAQVAAGADWIKLYTGLSPELLQAGIDAAHRHGRPAVAHLEDIAWTDALDMGLDGIVHLMPTSPDLLSPEQRSAWQADSRGATFSFFEWWEHFDPDGPQADLLVASFQQHRPVFDATLIAFHAAFVQDQDNLYKRDAARYAPPRLLASWNEWFTFAIGWTAEDFIRARAVWPKLQRMAVRLHATDARMTIGTDLGNPWVAPGISLHREMQLLAEAGVPASRLLLAATRNAADALGAGDRLGRIATGFEADLLVLDADPLLDIGHTLGIHAVVVDGRLLDSDELNRLKGE